MKNKTYCKAWLPLALIAGFVHCATAQEAGIRPYTAAELKRWTFVCEGLKKAMPAGYGDYKVSASGCGSFDWSERDTKGAPLTVYNKQNQPTGNNPYFNAAITLNDDSADAQGKRIDEMLLQNRNADGSFSQKQIELVSARQSKFNQSHNPVINVSTNVVVAISKPYHISTKPLKLALPIAAFAYLYTVPDGKTVGNDDDEVAYDNTTVYRDKAIVVISAKPPRVVAAKVNPKGTLAEDKISPPDGTIVSTAPVKNIVVEVSGYEKDVRELVAKIDWKALQALIGK